MAREGVAAWAGIALTATAAVVAGTGFIIRVDERLAALERRFAVVESAINELAPRKVKITEVASWPPPLAIAEAAPEPAPPELSAADLKLANPRDWRDRFVLDHCTRCPACCLKLNVSALP